jgi:hypothetical protein
MTNSVPVMAEALSDATKATSSATSSGRFGRPSGRPACPSACAGPSRSRRYLSPHSLDHSCGGVGLYEAGRNRSDAYSPRTRPRQAVGDLTRRQRGGTGETWRPSRTERRVFARGLHCDMFVTDMEWTAKWTVSAPFGNEGSQAGLLSILRSKTMVLDGRNRRNRVTAGRSKPFKAVK